MVQAVLHLSIRSSNKKDFVVIGCVQLITFKTEPITFKIFSQDKRH